MAARAAQKETTEVAALGMLEACWPSRREALQAAVDALWALLATHLTTGTWKVGAEWSAPRTTW